MKDYFNSSERENHLVITCTQIAVEELLQSDALSEEERKELNKAYKALLKFNGLVYDRLGEAYRRKILRTTSCNVVKIVGRFAPQQEAISHCAQEDIQPCFEKLQMLCCMNCERHGECFKDCAVYNMGVALDIEGTGDKCPYYADSDFDFGGEDDL